MELTGVSFERTNVPDFAIGTGLFRLNLRWFAEDRTQGNAYIFISADNSEIYVDSDSPLPNVKLKKVMEFFVKRIVEESTKAPKEIEGEVS